MIKKNLKRLKIFSTITTSFQYCTEIYHQISKTKQVNKGNEDKNEKNKSFYSEII